MTKTPDLVEMTPWNWNDIHGEDSIKILRQGKFACAMVADGVSLSAGGGNASAFAADQVEKAFMARYGASDPVRADFESFVEDLLYLMESASSHEVLRGSQTTLSLAVIEEAVKEFDSRQYLLVDYFCSGDSPIVTCRKQQLMAGLPDSFVCTAVHEAPLVVEQAGRLYSFFDATTGKFEGSSRVGRFYLEKGDTVLLMTDGVPYMPAIVRDVGDDKKFRFLNQIQNRKTAKAFDWLKNYVKDHPLSDDASIITIHHR